MNGTPRMPAAFPTTPRSDFRPRPRGLNRNAQSGFHSPPFPSPASSRPSPATQPLKDPLDAVKSRGNPVIPLELVDAPSQRFYVVAFYIALTAWRTYDAWHVEDDLDSTWLFLKWVGFDATFFLALPAFRIPWMEWTFATTLSIWLLHAIANAFLMYKIPIPVLSWLGALVKIAYDRELSISEHRVKPADILHNSSIILGKQIIHILPEGFAILNPEKENFCLDAATTAVGLPIQINQTTPISIELLRYDLDTEEVETIVIGAKQARQMKKQADKGYQKSDTKTPRLLHYPVSKKGLYQLQRVIDESKLDVRKRSFDVAVVPCPKAAVSTSKTDRCTGDLSSVSLQVNGVPPFKVKYSKRIEHQQFSSIVQSISPADLEENLGEGGASNIVLDPRKPHMGWTKTASVSVDINEVLNQNGSWTYVVEDVEDGLGNRIAYDVEKTKERQHEHRVQSLTVHNRPKVRLVGCDSEHFLRVAKEDTVNLPISVLTPRKLHLSDWPLDVKYTFFPETEEGIPPVEEHFHHMASERDVPRVSKAGRYNVESIGSQFCQGEVAEPSSCLLYNPPKPDLSLESEDIFDKCAGNPIGMTVSLDFIGTPPFKVRYTTTYQGKAYPKVQTFNGMRGQLEFKERSAGSYIYQILEIEDEVYGPIALKHRDLLLKQDIRPPASAMFQENDNVVNACLGQPVALQVRLIGEGPWDLDYEVVHGGRRKKSTLYSQEDILTIMLPEQSEGGRYSVVLTGVQDKSRCRTALKEERHVEVRPEQPSAAFGDIEGKRTVSALEGKQVKLPLRLKGLAPWTVKIRSPDEQSSVLEYTFKEPNAVASTMQPGTYEILSVHDSCPGLVDPRASTFTVSWIARPSLSLKDNEVERENAHIFRKAPVCQGDEAALTVGLTGNPPFHLKYQQKFEPVKGPAAISNKPLSLASSSALINLETSKAGDYTYTFTELGDERYAHDKKRFSPLTIKQQVYAPPTAKFTHAGTTYGYCKDDPGFDTGVESMFENIPITLTGAPPFAVEIAITHHGVSPRPEIVRIKDIFSTSYSWALSRATLDLGAHSISIRSVKDSRGCESVVEQDLSSVRVTVSSPPTIIPLESNTDYCVGDRVSFSLSGQAPFDVFYNFQNRERKARVSSNEFKRIAESPGEFVITGVSDSAMGSGKCRARKDIKKDIHPYPSVKISHGKTSISDIHEGGEVEILFEFTGTPPFEFTYTRSENAKKGRKPQVLETRHDTSYDFSKTVRASDEGTYEVVAIKDKYCAYASPSHAAAKGGKGQKLLQN